MKFYVDFRTGVGNFYAKTLEEAMERADKEAAYTQQNIEIYSVDDYGLMDDFPEISRIWQGYEYRSDEELDENPIVFGTFGFYSDWC